MADQTVFNLRKLAMRRKALGIKPRKFRGRRLRVNYPQAIEREYRRKLSAYVADLKAFTAEMVLPRIPELVREYRQSTGQQPHTDAWFDSLDDMLKAVGLRLSRKWTAAELEDIANRTGRDANSYVKAGLEKELERVLGVNILSSQPWLKDVLEGFSKQNVNLITSVSDRYFEEIRNLTFLGVSQGLRAEEISAKIQERTDIAGSRADLIARDQVGKIVSQTNELQQKSLGVSKYVWSTSLDERVRGDPSGLYPNAIPSHYDREGKVFSWDDPPEDGHPGMPIQCRCAAIPYMEDLIESDSGFIGALAVGAAALLGSKSSEPQSEED